MENHVWILDRADSVFEDGVVGCEVVDIWHEIASKLDGSAIYKLAATSQWFWETLSDDYVWKKATLLKLQLFDPHNIAVAFPWFTLYSKNFDGTHLFTRNNARHLNLLDRMGGVVFEEENAILTWDILKFKGASKQEKFQALLQAENFKTVTEMKPGIWIADLHENRCFCGEECTRRMKSFDVRHIELFATEEFATDQIFYLTAKTANINMEDAQVAGFSTAAIIGSCHKDANLEVFENWEEGVQFMVTPNGVTIKVFVAQEQPLQEQLHHRNQIEVMYNKLLYLKTDSQVMAIDVLRAD